MEISWFTLINCEIGIDLRWARNCVLTEISRTFRVVNPISDSLEYRVATQTTSATFQINNAKLYVSVVTLSNNDHIFRKYKVRI